VPTIDPLDGWSPQEAPTGCGDGGEGRAAHAATRVGPLRLILPDPAREAAYVKLNSSTITDEEFSVTNAGTLESWYRVKAVDQTGNRSSSSNAAYIDGGYPTGGQEPGGDELPVVR